MPRTPTTPVDPGSDSDTVYVYTKAATSFCLVGNNSASGNFYVYDSASGGLSNTPQTTLAAAQGICAAANTASGTVANTAGVITVS